MREAVTFEELKQAEEYRDQLIEQFQSAKSRTQFLQKELDTAQGVLESMFREYDKVCLDIAKHWGSKSIPSNKKAP